MNMLLSEIAKITGGTCYGAERAIASTSIDTRTLAAGDLYIALKGENFDGNDFIQQAQTAGASAVLGTIKAATTLPQIVVKDSRLALAELAGAWKSKLKLQTIAVTGSNGKTTVKEMLASILGLAGQVLSTHGNLNNAIGVPLTLLKLRPQHQYAVLEVGANHSGEIAYSCAYVKPDIAILNNVGLAHVGTFGSIDQVAQAKGEIVQSLAADGVAILNRDDGFYNYCRGLAADRKVVTFGSHEAADFSAQAIHSAVHNNAFTTDFTLSSDAGELSLQLKLAGEHNVMNALAAAAGASQLGVDLATIKSGLERMQPVTARLQPLLGKHGGLIIDDTYNASPNSLKAALDVLLASGGQPWVVLGDLGELGANRVEIHKELGDLIKTKHVMRLLTIGSDAEYTSLTFGKGATFFSSQAALIDCLNQELTGNESLLIKGSRMQKMENIVAQLVDHAKEQDKCCCI